MQSVTYLVENTKKTQTEISHQQNINTNSAWITALKVILLNAIAS